MQLTNGANILSMSLGGYNNSRVLRDALANAYGKAILVAAAGNDALPIYRACAKPGQPYGPCFPAAYSFVLGVEALDKDGNIASFSNIDCDGPNFSAETSVADPEGFNYELTAPGVHIASTIPNGQYRYLSGTSMAAPLVAGAISALTMVKEYDSQEILWGDLLHSSNVLEAYNITNRPAELDFLGMQMRDRKDLKDGEIDENSYATNDGEADAGETLSIYPIIRTTFGAAKNIKLRLEMGDNYEDASLVDILTPSTDFGMSLSAYGKGVSVNPLKVKISDKCADARRIKMKVVASADGSDQTFEKVFTLTVSNMHKIGGLIEKDTTLTSDKTWYVTENIGIPQGVTMTIEPGTRLEFAKGMGLSSSGRLIANGTPEKPIILTKHNNEGNWAVVSSPGDTIRYCKISYSEKPNNNFYNFPYMEDCELTNCTGSWMFYPEIKGIFCNLYENTELSWIDDYVYVGVFGIENLRKSNFIYNYGDEPGNAESVRFSTLDSLNYFNNTFYINGTGYSLGIESSNPIIDHSSTPSYLGSSREDLLRPYIYEIDNGQNTFGKIDLSNMLKEPVHEAHGIVWKVVVDGKDAQDEYEQMAPLGVGKHSFCVWFNRPMNVNVAPQISFGVRDPYTQVSVGEDGSWSADSTKYTAYVTITGKTASDGVNQIYVRGAEDNEFFECPYEKTRFRVQVQAAGSLATGFEAEPALGRVNLKWNNENNDFSDAMGFNVYRYNMVNDSTYSDTIRLNKEILSTDTTAYTDYAVVPGTTYYYYYKVLSTDLKEYDVSNVVACTPLTSQRGDANGSGDVDVADVVTTVNYAAGQDPKPFIFEAADMNTDRLIDILDVIGIIQTIINPNGIAGTSALASATYSIENGTVYVDCPVAIAGVQVQLATDGKKDITVCDDLKDFENTSAWLTDDDYIFLAYNMNGLTLSPGKHALLNIGDAQISNIRLSDAQGHNIEVTGKDATGINTITSRIKNAKGVYNLNGQKVAGSESELNSLPDGVYIINGTKVVK